MDSSDTMFAPAERADTESVLRDAEALQGAVFAEQILHMMPSIFMVLNRERQIVYKSQGLMDFLGASSNQEVLGKRPGELLDCIHAHEHATGCGTTEFCRECGAVKAILKSQQDKVGVADECRITSTAGDAYEFRVSASPFTFEGMDYTLFVLVDIRDEKRRHNLERTFFHDINNILGVILGYSSLVKKSKDMGAELLQDINRIEMAGKELIEEIASHRRLLQAENGDLAVTITNIESLSLLAEVIKLFSANEKWRDRNIIVEDNSDGVEIASDKVLLRRVLGNMVKNALEATQHGGEVCLTCARSRSRTIFSVHNPGHMPRSIQLQMFQRSFSTKGKGRGIGTYSMKLFGEQYLKGKVWFTSSEEKGTTFFISLPLFYEEA